MPEVGASEHGEALSFARSHARVLRFGGPAIVRRGRRPVALRPPHWRGLLLTALVPYHVRRCRPFTEGWSDPRSRFVL